MFAYVVRRIIYTLPILLGIALVTFLLFNVAGGDPVLQMLGKHADARSIQELRLQLRRNLKRFVGFASNDSDNGALGQGIPFDDDLSVYHCSCG